MNKIERGDIWFADLPQVFDNVQSGKRFVVVCSNNKANYFSPVITVLPITSRDKRNLPIHVPIEIDEPSYVLCEQIMTINKNSLIKYKTKCTREKMAEIDRGLSIQLNKKGKVDFDIEKVNRLVKSVIELEQFINKYRHLDLTEIETSLNLLLRELYEYCNAYNKDYRQFYNPLVDKGVKENVV